MVTSSPPSRCFFRSNSGSQISSTDDIPRKGRLNGSQQGTKELRQVKADPRDARERQVQASANKARVLRQLHPSKPARAAGAVPTDSAPTSASPSVKGAPSTTRAASSENIERQVQRVQKLEKNAALQQAAYLLVSQRLGRPLTDAQKELMWRVSDVRVNLLSMLPLGRSNVTTDVKECGQAQNSDAHSTYRAVAARRLKYDVQGGTSPETEGSIRAALTAVAGAGSCGDHSNLAMHLLGPVLKDGECAIQQREKEADMPNGMKDPSALDHSWVVVKGRSAKGEGGELGAPPEVVLDAWADGPVMLTEDCAFIKNKNVKDIKTFDAQAAKQAHLSFMNVKNGEFEPLIAARAAEIQQRERLQHPEVQPAASENLGDDIEEDDGWDLHQADTTDSAASTGSVLSTVVVWEPTIGLHSDFLNKLNKFDTQRRKPTSPRMVKAPPEELENQALAIARSAPNVTRFQDIEGLGRAIVQKAKSLGEPEDRSLIAIPPISLGLIEPPAPQGQGKM